MKIKMITNNRNIYNKKFERILKNHNHTTEYLDNNISALYEFNDSKTDYLPLVIIYDGLDRYYYNILNLKELKHKIIERNRTIPNETHNYNYNLELEL